MSRQDFDFLCNSVAPMIQRQDTHLREAIPVRLRVAITLRFLATGDSYTSLQYLFRVSKQSVSDIVIETSQALIDVLREYIKMPSNPTEWSVVANQFFGKWNFPNCVGAMDGKHIVIQAPFDSGSEYFNYKGHFSIVLFALVDANYNFTYINVGCQGRISDGGVFKNTSFHQKLHNERLNLPQDCPLPGRSQPLPYVFVGDEAFPLTTRIMKPFSGTHDRGSMKRNFNYRLSRARRVVENVFGISSAIFRVLRKPILLGPEKVTIITTCIAYMHNFLRRDSVSRSIYTPTGTFDHYGDDGNIINGTWRQEEPPIDSFYSLRLVARRSAHATQSIRNEFGEFFLNDRI